MGSRGTLLIVGLIVLGGVAYLFNRDPGEIPEPVVEQAAEPRSARTLDASASLPMPSTDPILELDKQKSLGKGADERLNDYFKSVADKDYENARATLEAILKDDPNNEAALANLGRLYARYLKDPDKAIEPLKKAVSLNPENYSTLSQLVNLYDGKGGGQAESFLKEMEQKYPDSANVAEVLGTYYTDNGRTTEAIPYLERAAQKSDKPQFALGMLGDAYARAADHQNAVGSYEKVLSYYDKQMRAEADPEIQQGYMMEMDMTRMSMISSLLSSGNIERASEMLDGIEQRQGTSPATERLRRQIDAMRGE